VPDPSSELLAHGVGGRSDLPIPADYAFLGAAAALVVSFVVLGLFWREPRFDGPRSGRPLPTWLAAVIDSRVVRGAVVVVALAYTAWVVMAAVFGNDTLVNPTFGAVYVLLWVGLVPASLLLGPIYRLCNPLRWLHRGVAKAAGTDPSEGLVNYPARLGYWPGAVFLFAFVWLELVNPSQSQDLSVVRLWFLVVAALLMVGAAVFGDRWFEHADPFEVYSTLISRLSPFARRDDGVLVIRNPLENLDCTPARPGLVAVVAVLFGSTAFDSFKESSRWLGWSQQYSEHSTAINGLALLSFCLIVLVSFVLASQSTRVLGHVQRGNLPNLMAHSVVPIVVGYVVAHYLTYFMSTGVQTLQQLGDPLGRGWTLADPIAEVDKFWIYGYPSEIAVSKVVAVVIGHVLGVISAHDRAVRLLPREHAIRGQLPMLVLMVAYTLTGLWLLFSS
jgi:hypothetical protein